ncbi:MAG: hypothetical protein HN368_12195 [Spirochaetales bacterium]|jgi:hypothetical protein|nr:hypothetical protein [Spirochaetales bacterium]
MTKQGDERHLNSNRRLRFPSLSERVGLTADLLRIHAPLSCFKEIPNYRKEEIGLPGLTYLYANENRQKAYLLITSEILGKRYPEKLNCENIEYALERINSITDVELDVELLLNYGCVSEVHVTDDLLLSHDPQIYLYALRSIPIPDKINRTPYHKESVRFSTYNKDKRHRFYLTLYDKYREIKRHRCRQCEDELFRDVVRIELKLESAEMIKKYLKIRKKEPPTIREVLQCHESVNADTFRNVWQKQDIEIPNDDWLEERYRREWNDLLQEHRDFDGVAAYLRTRLPESTARRWIKTYGGVVNSNPEVFRPMEELTDALDFYD